MQRCSLRTVGRQPRNSLSALFGDQRVPELIDDLSPMIEAVRCRRPIIHCITNPVSIHLVANALLAVGASPIMAYDPHEAAEVVAHADSLILNLGTLTLDRKKAMYLAADAAVALRKPVAIDPVGIGISSFRRHALSDLLSRIPSPIIRGNASEILNLTGSEKVAHGVDAAHPAEAAVPAAAGYCNQTAAVIAITGASDWIVDGSRKARVNNGHPLMSRVTGVGCAATAIIGAFAAVEPDGFRACAAALAVVGVAGQMAAAIHPGPGSFAQGFLDSLYRIGPAELRSLSRLIEYPPENALP